MTDNGKLYLRVEVEFELDTLHTEYDITTDQFYEDPVLDALYFLARKLKEGKVSYDCRDADLKLTGFEIDWGGGLDWKPKFEPPFTADRSEASRIPEDYR